MVSLRLSLILSLLVAGCGDGTAQIPTSDTGSTSDVAITDTPRSDTAQPGPDPLWPTNWSETPAGFRSQAEICQAWDDSGARATETHVPGEQTCEASTLTEEARGDGVRRLSFYRWLVGMPFSYDDTSAQGDLQQCAFYLDSNGLGITREPPTDQPCYDPVVTEVAAKSILAGGTESPSASIDLFMTEPSHRVLLLAPGLGSTATGHHGETTCHLIFGDGWEWEPPLHRTVAFPAPGANPQPPARWVTLLPATGHRYDAQTVLEIGARDGLIAATVTRPVTGYGETYLAAELDAPPEIGVEHTVSVRGIDTDAGRVDEQFTFTYVQCP